MKSYNSSISCFPSPSVWNCAQELDEFVIEPTDSMLNKFSKIDRCLKVLENVSSSLCLCRCSPQHFSGHLLLLLVTCDNILTRFVTHEAYCHQHLWVTQYNTVDLHLLTITQWRPPPPTSEENLSSQQDQNWPFNDVKLCKK